MQAAEEEEEEERAEGRNVPVRQHRQIVVATQRADEDPTQAGWQVGAWREAAMRWERATIFPS